MKILAVSSDIESNVSKIRIRIPLEIAGKSNHDIVSIKSFNECQIKDWRTADLVIFQRSTGHEEEQRMTWLKRHGIPVIYEIDDLLFRPADHLITAKSLVKQGTQITRMLALADYVTTSTERLAEQLKKFGKPIFVIPNYGAEIIQEKVPENVSSRITLILAASDHQQVQPVATALECLYPDDRFEIVAIGPIAACLRGYKFNYTTLPGLDRENYLKTLAGFSKPIGIIPMDDSLFSSCKSAIKFFDYAALCIPSICSNVPPYSDVITNGIDGLLSENNSTSWRNSILKLIESDSLRISMQHNAQTLVAGNYSLIQAAAAWSDLFRMIEQKDKTKLTQANTWSIQYENMIDLYRSLVQNIRQANHRRIKQRRTRFAIEKVGRPAHVTHKKK